jgi:K+-sensing histidine kinase KdpD
MSRRAGWALLTAVVAPLALSAVVVPWRTHFPNTDAALALELVVVAVAMTGNRVAGIVAACSVAAWFDFFLTRPYERFTITRPADAGTTVALLVVGLAVTELAMWGHHHQQLASTRAGYLEGIRAAATVAAVGGSPTVLIDDVCERLTVLLSLRSCHFQYGVAGVGEPAVLERDGRLRSRDGTHDDESPAAAETWEIIVDSGGTLVGRFLMEPLTGARPTLEQRLVAVALADQVGASLEHSPSARAGT